MSRSLALLCVLIVGTTGISGCFGDDTPKDPASPPVWSPGHTWSWETRSSEQATFDGESYERSDSGVLTHKVLAKAPMRDGPPVYWIKTSTEGDPDPAFPGRNLLDGGEILFVDPASLTVIDSGFGETDHPCGGGTISLRQDRADDTDDPREQDLDLLRFPLALGNKWEGRVDDVLYSAEVAAAEKKQTPAGTFQTMRIDLTYDVEADGDEVVDIVEQRTSVWYAPDVEHIIASTLSLKASIQEDDQEGVFEITHDIKLASYDLAKEDDAILPQIRDPGPDMSDDPRADQGYRIVRIGDDEPNIAEGPFTATFGVSKGDGPSHVEDEEATLSSAEIEDMAGGKTLRWRIQTVDDEAGKVIEGTGATFAHTFEEGGRYDIFVDAVDPDETADSCSTDVAQLVLSSRLYVYHREIHVINVTAGPASPIDVTSLPVAADSFLVIRHQIDRSTDDADLPPEASLLEDRGAVVVDGAGVAGRIDEEGETFGTRVRESGTLKITWEPIGKSPPDGEPVPVVTGHEVTIDVFLQKL